MTLTKFLFNMKEDFKELEAELIRLLQPYMNKPLNKEIVLAALHKKLKEFNWKDPFKYIAKVTKVNNYEMKVEIRKVKNEN